MPKKLILAADEFYRDPLFVICGVAINNNQMESFNKRWDQLRASIKHRLILDKPILRDHNLLTGDLLPEIHAVDMIQSDSYYRLEKNDPGYRNNYWIRQQRWLESGLKIISSYNPKIFLYPHEISSEEISEIRKYAFEIYMSGVDRPEKKKAKLFSHLYSSPYHTHLPNFILGIDEYLAESNYTAEMFFDEFDNAKGFHDEKVLEILRSAGKLKSNFVSGEYSSHGHNILQAADAISYIASRDRYNEFSNDSKLGDYFFRLSKRYIYPHSISHGRQMTSSEISTLFLKRAVLTGPCMPRSQPQRSPQQIMDELLDAERRRRSLDQIFDSLSAPK